MEMKLFQIKEKAKEEIIIRAKNKGSLISLAHQLNSTLEKMVNLSLAPKGSDQMKELLINAAWGSVN